MANQVFLNTVFVQGFPEMTSRFDLLKEFGGRKGYIEDLHFTNRPGEPKKAFIAYRHASSVPLALEMDGTRMWSQYELTVEEINEWILCDYVPGENQDIDAAFDDLQRVLGLVVQEKETERREVRRLNTLLDAHATTAKAHTTQNNDLTTQLTQTRAQLKTIVERCTQVQAENESLQKRLAAATEQLKASREVNESLENDVKVVRGRLEEAFAEQESTMKQFNLRFTTLEKELQRAKDERFEARSNLWRTETSLEKTEAQAREAERHAMEVQRKRQRTEEWLASERETKKRLKEDMWHGEARYMENLERVEQEVLLRKQLEERLSREVEGRKEVEEQLVRANAKLDKVFITDKLLAAFLKMDDWTIRVMEGVLAC